MVSKEEVAGKANHTLKTANQTVEGTWEEPMGVWETRIKASKVPQGEAVGAKGGVSSVGCNQKIAALLVD